MYKYKYAALLKGSPISVWSLWWDTIFAHTVIHRSDFIDNVVSKATVGRHSHAERHPHFIQDA